MSIATTVGQLTSQSVTTSDPAGKWMRAEKLVYHMPGESQSTAFKTMWSAPSRTDRHKLLHGLLVFPMHTHIAKYYQHQSNSILLFSRPTGIGTRNNTRVSNQTGLSYASATVMCCHLGPYLRADSHKIKTGICILCGCVRLLLSTQDLQVPIPFTGSLWLWVFESNSLGPSNLAAGSCSKSSLELCTAIIYASTCAIVYGWCISVCILLLVYSISIDDKTAHCLNSTLCALYMPHFHRWLLVYVIYENEA